MVTLSSLFEAQLTGELDTVQQLLRGEESSPSHPSCYYPHAEEAPSYHGEVSSSRYGDIIQKELASRRNMVSMLKQYLSSLWGDSETERYISPIYPLLFHILSDYALFSTCLSLIPCYVSRPHSFHYAFYLTCYLLPYRIS